MSREPAKCGTVSGYNRHRKRGETTCEPCLVAQRKYHRVYNDKRRGHIVRREAAQVRRLARSMLAYAEDGTMSWETAVKAAIPLFDLADRVDDGFVSFGLVRPGQELTAEEIRGAIVSAI